MPLTDEERRHLERRLREERAQIVRILDRYQDEQLARLRRRRPRLGPDTATTLAQARVVSVSQG